MRSPRRFSLLICSLLLLTGCYESAVPIAEPGAASLDHSLQGTWVPTEPSDDAPDARFWVAAFNEHEYLIEMCCDEDLEVDGRENDGRVFFRAFLSDVESRQFVNVQIVGTPPDEEQTFFLYRLEREGTDSLALHPLSDDALEAAAPETSEALFELVRANGADPAFYGDDVLRLRRVEQ